MSRILDATCENNIVKVEGKTVTATILSQGKKASTGVALLQGDKLSYVTANSSDLHDLIVKLSSLVQLLSDTLSAIGTGMTGPTTAPPGTLPTSITQLATAKSELDTMKDNLK